MIEIIPNVHFPVVFTSIPFRTREEHFIAHDQPVRLIAFVQTQHLHFKIKI